MADRRPFSEIMNINTVMEMDAEDDEEKANMFHEPMRRNLLDVFDKTLPPVADERMCVYLRVRPFSPKEIEEGEDQGCVKALNEYMISANAPKDSHTFKSTTYGLGKAKHNFTFSRVFPESTSQKEFFSATMLKLVQDFIEGQNCLVFTYGITNAGKTYTIQGNPKDAGVLPRGLDVLFNSINGKQWPSMDLKPRMFNDVVKLTPEEEEKERKIKELVMKMNSSEDLNVMTLLGEDAVDQSMMNTTSQSNETSSKACSTESQEDILMEVQDRVREETAVDVADQGRIRFSVWVSFAEIYNEQIFDLLEPMPRKNNARRPVLKLSEDRRGSPYIKGLKEINVTSADEAYKLLTIGQRNLKTACTRLNHSSSRSHCIFNIKIIRVADKGNPKFARVSMLSLCDLAGSERQAKTQTTGERLKEAGNINTSLLTLGRCIELLRNNQNHKDNPKIIPFRDSRLTRLFQNFFCGRGKAAMIVNVSQCASMFDETLNVFKFSAIAKQVVLPKPEERPTELYINPKRTTKGFTVRSSSIGWDNSTTPAKRHIPSELADPEEEVDEGSGNDEECYIEFLEARICELEAQIKELKRERMAHEIHIRQEVCKEMQDQFVKIEDMYSTMLKETKQEEEERFEKRLKLLMDNIEPQPSKRIRLEEPSESGGSKTKQNTSVMVDGEDEWVSSLLLYQERIKVQERDASLVEARDEINKLRSEITELQFQTADLLRKNKEHAEKLQKAEEAQKKTEEEATTRIDEIKESRSIVTEKAPKCEDDMGHSVLLETLGQQLQEAKDKLRQQEKEIKDLNEMLVDAGNTFHQKEEEIAKLKSVIAEDEEKMEHQVETIRDLRQLLEESRQTLEESEKKIEAKNHSIGNMKEELTHLQGRLTECHKTVSASEALKKCEEELSIMKNRLTREEQDFQQREKALIHGYTAEINNLKSQMALLKSQNYVKSAHSPVKMSLTPDKLKSPSKRRRKFASEDEPKEKERKKKEKILDESFRLDVVRQLKDLQKELNQNRTMSAELRRKLQDARQCAEVMQQQLESKADVEHRLEQSQFDLLELQQKFEEMSSASGEVQRQLESKKELQAELTDNQSESADLRQKLRIAESSGEDLEKRLAAATQQLLQAEVAKVELENQLKQVVSKLEQNEKEKEMSQRRIKDQRKTIKDLNKEKGHLKKENETYHITLEAHNKKIEELSEERDQLKEKLNTLEQELKYKTEDLDRELQKKEELEMVVSELRAMINKTASDLETRSVEVKQLSEQAAKTDKKTLHEDQLQSALNEANSLLQKQSSENTSLQKQADSSKARIAQLEARVMEYELKEKDEKINNEESVKLVEQKNQELQQMATEVKALKSEIEAIAQKSQEQIRDLEEERRELAIKGSRVEELEKEIEASKFRHEQEIKDLEVKLHSFAEDASAKHIEMQQKVHAFNELESILSEKEERLKEMETVQKKLETAQNVLKATETAMDVLKLQLTNAENKASETSEKFKFAIEEMNTTSSQKQALEKQVADLSTDLSVLQQEKAELQSSKKILEEALNELRSSGKKIEEELAGKSRVLEEMTEKELTRCKKLTSLEEAQKKSAAYHKKRVAELESALANKEKEVEDLRSSLMELQKQASECNHQLDQLSEASVKIADLRSQLHMKKAVLQKYKDEVAALTDEKEACQRQAEILLQEADKINKEKGSLLEEVKCLKESLRAVEETANEKVTSLEKEIEKLKASTEEQGQSGQSANEKATLLEEKVKESKDTQEHLVQCLEKVGQELALTKAQLEEAKLAQAQEQVLKPESCATESTKIQQLQAELNAEHAKSQELERQVETLRSADSTPGTPGSLRRLRKEKIRVESDLVAARFEIERLKEQLQKVLNTKSMKDSPAFLSQSLSGGSFTNSEKGKLQAELAEKEKLLREAETAHQRCECELLEVRSRLSNAMVELKEIKAIGSEKMPENETRQPLFRQADKHFLQSELKKSQEREASLRQELKQASVTMVTNNATIAGLEEQLADSSKKLEEMHMQLNDLQTKHETSNTEKQDVEKLKSQLKELEEEIVLKSKLLAAKQDHVKELQQMLAAEQAQKDLIVKDAKANEAAVQRLKDALVEQEETMAKQDSILIDKENEIKFLMTELTKITDRYQQLVSQSGDSGRELRELTCVHARLQAEKEQCMKDLIAVKEERARLVQDVHVLKVEKESIALNLKIAEETRENISRDLGELRRERDAAIARYKQAMDDCETLEKKVAIAMEEKKQLEEKLNMATIECSRLTSTVTKEGKTTQNLEEQLVSTQKELAKVKKAYEKDTQCLLTSKAHEGELKTKVKALQLEVRQMEEKMKKGEEERDVWREQRDKLVGQMETILHNLSQENKDLKAQQQTEHDHYSKLLEQERVEKKELKRQLKTLQRAKDSVVADLKHTNHTLQVELALAQGVAPPPRPPPPQHYSFRVNESDLIDDVDTTGHMEVDATPPVAAKSLRKSRKRGSTLNSSTSQNTSVTGKTKRKTKDIIPDTPETSEKMRPLSNIIEQEEKKLQSPVTRSAKKILHIGSTDRCPPNDNQENISNPSSDENSQRGRRKAKREDLPIECAPYQLKPWAAP
ncbi:kinesin-like protein KIF20B isoform X3 [Pomacea canaliculata]|uniref:kinesin-like protein KIF20B isoform X3 n=1 Tax=Pomacea canaliculata TaxID=400727 RepID=UPI000D732511|nr:kinesin-like protein KIF20B isoform X3 [Pomacea canaliculata]